MKTRNKHRIAAGGILALFLAAAGINCSKNDMTILKDTHGIVARGYSAMRIDPMVFAGVITHLKKGEIVEILDRSTTKTWVGKENDFWYKVRTKDGVSGWVFGQTITIYTSKNKIVMDKIASEFIDIEVAQVKKGIVGKWWSTNEFGDFTDHCLEIYENNKYRSYMKNQEGEAIIGTYKIDLNINEILFSSGTSFKSNLDLVKRGNIFVIKRNMKDRELRFSRIAVDLPAEPDMTETNTPKPPAK
jgi:hypothetical protein